MRPPFGKLIVILFVVICLCLLVLTRSYDPKNVLNHIEKKENSNVHVMNSKSPFNCYDLPTTNTDIWLKAESRPTGLCNQLFGIYSFIPVAMLLNASLIISDVFSRHSFENRWPIPSSGWSKVPFSNIFDWEYFHNYWLRYGINTVEGKFYERCLSVYYKSNYTLRQIVRRPEFFPVNSDRILQMVHDSNISVPIPNRTILALSSQHGFITMFNFWSHLPLLKIVHESFQPAPTMQKYITSILNALPNNTVAVHLRLENDLWGNDNAKFIDQLELALKHIHASSCFQAVSNDSTGRYIDPPPLYISSGIFKLSTSDILSANPHPKLRSKATKALQQLQIHGFNQLYFRDQQMISLFSNITNNPAIRDTIGDPLLYSRFLPEEIAYIDLMVSRSAHCFINAHIGSSFSYFIDRMRYLDQGIPLGGDKINEENFGKSSFFKFWGLR